MAWELYIKDGNANDAWVVDNAMLEALQKDAGIPHLPTQETYQFRMAVSGQGPLAYQWSDKPNRLLYDACSIIEREAAAPDMLAVLGALVWQLDRMDDLPEELEYMVVEAKAAIAQAKGDA